MRRRRWRAPSPALVVSLLALFVALGGTTYAATSLPKNSVGTKQIRKGAVTKAKINKKTIAALHGRTGPRGPQGATGATGAAGPPGPQGSQGVVSAVSLTGVPTEPATAGLTAFAFAVAPATVTVKANQKVFGIASTSVRNVVGGQFGLNWAICSEPSGSSTLTNWGTVFSWLSDPSQNVAVTANALMPLAAGTYSIGACLAVEQLGKFNYNSDSSTTLLVLDG